MYVHNSFRLNDIGWACLVSFNRRENFLRQSVAEIDITVYTRNECRTRLSGYVSSNPAKHRKTLANIQLDYFPTRVRHLT